MAAGFDPDVATAAYMGTLSAAQHAKAIAYTRGAEWIILWSLLVDLLVAWIVLRTGMLGRIVARAHGPNKAVVACTLVFFAMSWLIGLPWSIYTAWWRERAYGLTKQALMGWLGESALSAVIGTALSVLLALAIYALMRRASRTWWAWSGAVAVTTIVVLVVLAPVLIQPLFNTYTPAPAGPSRNAVVALARRADVPSDKIMIFDGSKQSERYTANVSGLFGTARVAMSNTMSQQGADLAEVRGVVGHEMGHYKHNHAVLKAFVLGMLAMLMLFVADRMFPAVTRLMRADGVQNIADPAGLPVLMMIVSVLSLFAAPVSNTVVRMQETDADDFSFETAHEPDGLAKALVKTVEYRASSPSALEEMIFYDHPSVERRVHRAMVWKAQHPDLIGK